MISGNIINNNGDLQYTEKLREYVQNPVWKDYTELWSFISGSSEGLGQLIYEDISNYVQNIRDIDTCGLHQLYSIAKELNVEQMFSYDLAYPVDLGELMNNLSINRSYFLTTGVIDDSTLSAFYADTDLTSTCFTSGNLLTSYVVLEPNYITGFMMPSICACLTVNSTYSLDGPYSGIALEYQGFMDDIYYNPASVFDYSTSAEIISSCTYTLRNIAIRASYQRETLKTIAQKHAMIGTNKAIEKLLGEYILRTYTKKSDWRLYVEPSGALKPYSINKAYELEQSLPSIHSVTGGFYVQPIEYWDRTEYLNISAASPLICGVTDFATVTSVSSWIDISGNLCSGNYIQSGISVYTQGLCGIMITGGNIRYWEQDLNDTALTYTYSDLALASSMVDKFYGSVLSTIYGENATELTASGTMYEFQKYLYDLHAVSGLNYNSIIEELTGTPSDAYSATPVSAIPASGWAVAPTNLSGMHWKYIGVPTGYIETVSGPITGTLLGAEVPPANYKNQLYPTMASQPFIWNLVEKVYQDFPHIAFTLLFSDQNRSALSAAQVASGNISTHIPAGSLIDSWKFFNQEYIGYQTSYEQKTNLDYNEIMNVRVDKDGPFDVDALSTFILTNNSSLSTGISGYYDHIEKDFELSATIPTIIPQLTTFRTDMYALSAQTVFQFQYDQYEHQYMLYKDAWNLPSFGSLWMRYRNHPLPFPLSYGVDSDWKLQQLYTYGGLDSLGYIFSGHCFDFGIVGDSMWVLGRDVDGNDDIWVFENNYKYYPSTFENSPSDVTIYSIDSSIKRLKGAGGNIGIQNWVGAYTNNEFIIFVYVDSIINGYATFVFKHYSRTLKQFVNTIYDYRTISPITNSDGTITSCPNAYVPSGPIENVWRLSVSERFVHISYECVNNYSGLSEYVNGVTTIDINKDTLSTIPGSYQIAEWYNIMDNL